MPVLTLTKVDTTKTGKTRAYFNGATHWKEAYYLGKDVQLPPIGTVMDCATVSKRFDGSEFETWFLQGWAAVNGQTPAPATAHSAPAAYNAPAASGDGLTVGPADALRFISNMVGSAITSGAIKGPNDMSAWAAQAFRVVRSIQSGGLLADARTAKQAEKVKPAEKAQPVEEAIPEPPPREEGDPGFSDDVPF
jgi:hypothetical protein